MPNFNFKRGQNALIFWFQNTWKRHSVGENTNFCETSDFDPSSDGVVESPGPPGLKGIGGEDGAPREIGSVGPPGYRGGPRLQKIMDQFRKEILRRDQKETEDHQDQLEHQEKEEKTDWQYHKGNVGRECLENLENQDIQDQKDPWEDKDLQLCEVHM
ncbi:hypothetical protein L3Y34_017591 [Caenorhabditis briggsae]|uniref:Uncharacterized protein n=1 Tax=Caenorhabditis briggsae TaxID=6238 RepID=A0AAE9DJ50_CAEBR|nr:hypothetical protein L3Y34_017591 [Caenorhabditis briggsae]